MAEKFSTKVTPYADSAADVERIKKAAADFKFDDISKSPNKVIVVAGPEGTGKTHLACTMSEVMPVYLIDTEYRASAVIRKFDPEKVRHKVCSTYDEVVVAVKAILTRAKPGAIVLDSGSDLQTFAEIAYLKRTKMEKIYPIYNWSEVWAMCNALVDDIKFSPFTLVVTARVKEEYRGDKATGLIVPRIYSALPYKADMILQFTSLSKPGFVVKPQNVTSPVQYEIPRFNADGTTLSLPQFMDGFDESTGYKPKK